MDRLYRTGLLMANPNPRFRRIILLLAVAAGFATAYTQSPLFYSNQNQYLLHGLAQAGYGHLEHDWLANTSDPTPLFSLGIAAAYKLAGLWPLQAAYFLMLMGYFLSAWWLVTAVLRRGFCWRWLLVFAAIFTAAHAAIFRLASVKLTGVDYPFYFQSGVAGQYLLGPGIQPSAFGILFIASLAAFANGRPYLAACLGAAAGLFHATYLLPAALLTLGYMSRLLREKRAKEAGISAVLALAVAMPTVAYTLVVFPQHLKSVARAQQLLVEVRIPHHAVIARWFDLIAALQIGWMVVGLTVLRKSVLFRPLAAMAAGGLTLTLMLLVRENHTLALLFPWRVSAVLVPVTTAVLAAMLAARLESSRITLGVSAILFAGMIVGGVVIMTLGFGYRMNEAEEPLLAYVRDHASETDVYLIPTRFPPVGKGRGAVSTSFTPAPRPKPGSNLIPVDLQRFRLATGAPIYVDFKSVPYYALEVREWDRRMKKAEKWYATPDWDAAGIREQLIKEEITHVIVPRQQSIKASFLTLEYADDAYEVYRVDRGSRPDSER
jgi:hypothetical protein